MIKVCFTGPRPSKLGGYDLNSYMNFIILQRVINCLESLLDKSNHCYYFIVGGALGFDTICAITVLDLKEKYKDRIKLEVAVPFKDQSIVWKSKEDITRYNYILENADKVTYVDTLAQYDTKTTISGKYHVAKLQKRNEYMVDNSSVVITWYNGSGGGTDNCLRYAKRHDKTIINLY